MPETISQRYAVFHRWVGWHVYDTTTPTATVAGRAHIAADAVVETFTSSDHGGHTAAYAKATARAAELNAGAK